MEPRLPLQQRIDEPAGHNDISPPGDNDRSIIINALGPSPVETDDIIQHTGLAPASVYLILLELDLAGRLHRHPGGRVSIAMTD
jgi:DNA processing protein